MSKYPKFNDFLEAKERKDLIDAKDGLAGADYKGPLEANPSQLPAKGDKGKSLPYKNVDPDDISAVWVAPDENGPDNGLVFKGTPGLTTKNSIPMGEKPETNTKQPKQKKMTSEQFIDQTKEMSPTDFAKYVLEDYNPNSEITTITDLYGNEFTPDPAQTIQYLTGLMMGNPRILERFVREVKRREGLHHLIESIMDQPEAYDLMVKLMEEGEDGKERCGNLARSMHDGYMSVLDKIEFLDDDDHSMEEHVGPGLNQVVGSQDDDQGGKQGGKFGGGSPDYSNRTNPSGGPAMPSMGGKFGGGGDFGRKQQRPQFAGNASPLQPPTNKPNVAYMGESAADNLIGELAKYDHHRSRMMHHCKNC